MSTLPVNFSKITTLSDAEMSKVVDGLLRDDIANYGRLIAHGVPPRLVMEKFKPHNYLIEGVAYRLVKAGVTPEEIMKQIVDQDLSNLATCDRIALLTDVTAERLIEDYDSISKFAKDFLFYLNRTDKKLPPDILKKKIEDLFSHGLRSKREEDFKTHLGTFLNAGLAADDALGFITGFGYGTEAGSCRLLLEYGANPNRVAKKIRSPYLRLSLYGELKALGADFSEETIKELVQNCDTWLEDYLPTLIENGVSAELLAEKLVTIKNHKSFYTLVEAGVEPKSLYDKFTMSVISDHYEDLAPYIDFNQLVLQRVTVRFEDSHHFKRFLLMHAGWLVQHGVSQDLIVTCTKHEDNVGEYLDELFDALDSAHLGEIFTELSAKTGFFYKFPALVRHYDIVEETGVVSPNALHRLADEWFERLWSKQMWDSRVYDDIEFIFENLDTIMEIYPELDLQELVDRTLPAMINSKLLTEHLSTIMAHEIDKRRLAEELAINPGRYAKVNFSTVKLILEQGFSANWFIKNADYAYFSPLRGEPIGQEEVDYYLSHDADPDLVAYIYLCNHQLDLKLKGGKNLDEVIGAPTVWSKLL